MLADIESLLAVSIPIYNAPEAARAAAAPSSSGLDRLVTVGDVLKTNIKKCISSKQLEALYLDWLSSCHNDSPSVGRSSSVGSDSHRDKEMTEFMEMLAELEEAVSHSLFREVIKACDIPRLVKEAERDLFSDISMGTAVATGMSRVLS